MAVLISPGTSISVIDESLNIGSGPGTVPLIFIATQQDKLDPSGLAIAPGTRKENAGKLYSITSQRELLQTFGDPVFYQVSGSSLNGYPLNEYGLLASYSFLGISNLARVVRADIDLGQLEATSVPPSAPAVAGTYWLDETSTGSKYGLFKWTGTAPNDTWVPVTPAFIYNFPAGTTNVPTAADGVPGDTAIVFQAEIGELSYWDKSSASVWAKLGSTLANPVVSASVWPIPTDFATPPVYWIKTTSAAQGANIVLRKMSATTGVFVQVESPILANEAAATVYYSTDTGGNVGKVFVDASTTGELNFKYTPDTATGWTPLRNIVGSSALPVSGYEVGAKWYNAEIGIDGKGKSTVDMLIADGQGGWQNINLPGYTPVVGHNTLYSQSSDPRDNSPVPTLIKGDIWIDTDKADYPAIYRWNTVAWILVDNTDQTTPNGIIFTDARPGPTYVAPASTGGQHNNGLVGSPDLDPDAPDADLYPEGFLMWNTRFSTNVVKEWVAPFSFDGVTASPDATNNNSTGRWVNVSGSNVAGLPYMGSAATNNVIVKALQSAIASNEDIRAEDTYYNLITSPGYPETLDEMITLNDDRKNTAFIIGDTPFTLAATGTELQAWATNQAKSPSNSKQGLVTASKYLGVYYPSGLSTNLDGTDVVVPPSHMVLRTIAYSDQVAYPWFAPAGLQRGNITNATTVGYVNTAGQFLPTKLSEGQRDILYNNGINPIRTMPQGGIVVFGQKTRQPYASATDRINVVRLENYLRYQLSMLAQPFLFEPNDNTTRKAVKDAFDRFLTELITLRALYDFLTVCDTSNNTGARIDRNELWIDIAISPTKAIEYIFIPIRIKNTGSLLTSV